jgi:hypothetical protein
MPGRVHLLSKVYESIEHGFANIVLTHTLLVNQRGVGA